MTSSWTRKRAVRSSCRAAPSCCPRRRPLPSPTRSSMPSPPGTAVWVASAAWMGPAVASSWAEVVEEAPTVPKVSSKSSCFWCRPRAFCSSSRTASSSWPPTRCWRRSCCRTKPR
uniref:(northern house mosquito) hypothetical protein n=1 Tax=Culex pipiens TaxID=7175 RepID=A0A8D8DCC3_CULPI